MITSTPIAGWSWGEFGHDTDLTHEGFRRFHLALAVLDRRRLGTPQGGRVTVEITEAGSRGLLFEGDVPAPPLVSEGTDGAATLAAGIRNSLTASAIGSVKLRATCDGLVETATGFVPTEGMFRLTLRVSGAYFLVGLTTFSDAWMRYDLKGREQATVFAANRPRLAAALADISEALDVEIEPEDPTWFGVPTESGVENELDRHGQPQDVWGSFEIPYRNRVFHQTPEFRPGYAREAFGPVRYVPVAGERQVLGYLWSSDTDHAASFEPTEAADLDAHRAGLVWLERLRQAYERGLTPGAALTDMARYPFDPVAGRAIETEITEVETLQTLRTQAAGPPTHD
ncbi:hypothetical protein [Streptomyces lichenis]|uniref:Uncharacterized protein n=1 Tax=Streptomyces lichenis TaxID=2306967 RepID=A0ABT0II05_9ACTN|nr:hypothetical protein [Streptomyces lichenis]MCK8680968.1 hypothetical protein [Streptomyces lichenis]